jgi:predicted peptidase
MAQRRILLALLVASITCANSAVHAQEELTGMFRLTRQTTEVVELEFAEALDEVISKDEQLQWQVYVPESYNPQRPAGLFLFIDPDGHGRMPDQWQQVFTNHNMIWVGVRRTQPKTSEVRRVWQAILGSRAIAQDYAIDLQRMYVGGSLGTVPTAINTMLAANEFSGAIYVRGSFYSKEMEPDQLQALQRKFHVFITGTNDEEKGQIRSDYEKYQKDGIANVKLIFEMQRLGAMPKPDHMDEAFRFFDSRLRR